MSTTQNLEALLEPVKRMSKDLAEGAKTLTVREARYLVDAYYIMQENRIRSAAQVRTLRENGEPHAVIEYLAAQDELLEQQIKRALDKWTDGSHMGRWLKAITGIGPVIAAGLLAHIDMQPWTCGLHAVDRKVKSCTEKEPHPGPQCGHKRIETVGHIWSFAGLDPSITWGKGERRPYNAQLKTICAFKLGECFVKTQNLDTGYYGKIYATRKAEYQARNERGEYAEVAKRALESKNYSKDTDAYKAYSAGKLPPAHIHAMARRFAVKIFLSAFHAEYYRTLFHEEPPKPYALAILGHAHDLNMPGIDVE